MDIDKQTERESLVDYWVDYPYIGIGEKPRKSKRLPTEEDLERIIGG